MMLKTLAAAALVSTIALTPAFAVDTSMQIVLELTGNAQRDVTTYQCEGIDTPLTVEYVNAAPVFLAFVPVKEEKLVFVTVLSGSGAKYASGQYVWWTKGQTAELFDLTLGEDAKPISTCSETDNTP